jgi:uncharacterized protein (DUF2147 family)
MKKSILIVALFFSLINVNAQDAPLTGNWYSKDGSRQYQINETKDGLEAILVRSSRDQDKEGKLILSRIQRKGHRYRGIIYSPTDDLYTTVTISSSRKNKEVLVLKLKRMLLMDVTIRWYRNPF